MADQPVSEEARAFEQAVWRAIQSYPGSIEIDNVQKFREHLWSVDQPRHPHSAAPFMAGYLAGRATSSSEQK